MNALFSINHRLIKIIIFTTTPFVKNYRRFSFNRSVVEMLQYLTMVKSKSRTYYIAKNQFNRRASNWTENSTIIFCKVAWLLKHFGMYVAAKLSHSRHFASACMTTSLSSSIKFPMLLKLLSNLDKVVACNAACPSET